MWSKAWLNFTLPDHNGMEYFIEDSMEYENPKMEYSRKIVQQHKTRFFLNMEYSRNIRKILRNNGFSFFLVYGYIYSRILK